MIFLTTFLVTLDVRAADYTTQGWGSSSWTSEWVYGTEVNVANSNSDYVINGNTVMTNDGATSLTWETQMSVPLDISAITGASAIDFGDAIKSVIWSLGSNVEYGISKVGTAYLNKRVDIGAEEVYLTINGKRYDVSFKSNGSYSSGNVYGNISVDGYFPIDLSSTHSITKWDVSLHVKFLCSMSVFDVTAAQDTFQPWMRWRINTNKSGYCLEFLTFENSINVTGEVFKEQTEAIEQTHETQKSILSSVTDFFGSFFDNLIDSIISIFIPDSETMKGLFDRLNDFFSETFGFLYFPFDIFARFVSLFSISSSSVTSITFPGFSIMGFEVWPSIPYDLTSNELVVTVFGYVRIGTSIILIFAMINYLRNFFDKRFGGGGS